MRSIAELNAASREEWSYGHGDGRRARRALNAHVRATPLCEGAVIDHGGVLVASPELTFLDLARELGFHRTLLLGLLMCAKQPGSNCEPLTTAYRIGRLLARMRGAYGVNQATAAAQFLSDGAASAHEALLYMALTLPQRYGGYGLGGARFNVAIKVPDEHVGVARRRLFYVDLLWERAKLVVEYDSYGFHSGIDSRAMDAKKRTVLEALGYKVEPVNTAQLYDKNALGLCAALLAGRLGKRLRFANDGFAAANAVLRSLFPRQP
jgi:hypothetical protein